jgi:tetratricopeptide (TPR) repeat protein
MARVTLLMLAGSFCAAGLAQMRPMEHPILDKQYAYLKARQEGHFADAAARRDEARAMLRTIPAEAIQFPGWVERVVQMYSASGRTLQARSVLEEALARIGRSAWMRVSMLNAMARLWQQDGNLLTAVNYFEQAASVSEAARASVPEPPVNQAVRLFDGLPPDLVLIYDQLAYLNTELGRRDALAGVVEKIRRLAAKEDDGRLASLLERYSSVEEAVAFLSRRIERAPVGEQAGLASQLAHLYSGWARYDEAIGTLQPAIAAATAAGDDAGWLKENVIWVLREAHRLDEVDSLYKEMLAESRDGANGNRSSVISKYANYLYDTGRSAEGKSLIQDYMMSANLTHDQEAGLFYTLSTFASKSGDRERASEYAQRAVAQQAADKARVVLGPEIEPDMRAALSDAQAGRVEEALSRMREAMDRAWRAWDRSRIVWYAPQVALALAQHNSAIAAQQVFDQLFSVLEVWAPDDPQPLLRAAEECLRFLISDENRRSEAPVVLDRLRYLQADAHGAGTQHVRQLLEFQLQLESARRAPAAELRIAQDLVEMEESLSGPTSVRYLEALHVLAVRRDANGDTDGALALHLRRIRIADEAFSNREVMPANVRIDAAHFLAHYRKHDEADRLADEALALSRNWRPDKARDIARQCEEIRGSRQDKNARTWGRSFSGIMQ